MSLNPVNDALNAAQQAQGLAQAQAGHTRTMDAIHRIDTIRQDGEIERLRQQVQTGLTQQTADSSSETYVEELRRKDAEEEVGRLRKSLAERDALVLEWMHSNEVFKRLARQYGKKLGMTDEQRLNDLNITLADVAEEDPRFSTTKIGGEARRDLEIRNGK